jgi:hypothetical protein
MLKTLLPFIVVAIGLWYLPETYTFLRNLASSIFQEAGNRTEYTVEMKLSKEISFLPQKFGSLGPGISGYRIELNAVDQAYVQSAETDEVGNVQLNGIRPGKYKIRVAKDIVFEENEIASIEAAGESAIDESILIPTYPIDVVISKDQYIPVVIRK